MTIPVNGRSSLRSSALEAWSVACRPTLVFIAAYMLSVTPHEAVHAAAAYLLGFNATVFQMWVNPEIAGASSGQLAIIAASGPIFSVSVGVVCWAIYKAYFQQRRSGLVFLMLAIIGIYSFLGPLVGAALGGDLHTALTLMAVAKVIPYLLTAIGLTLLPTFMFLMGKELLWWAPRKLGRFRAVLSTTVAPWLVGTALTLLLYWPLPVALARSTLTGSIFWVFAAAGAASGFSAERPASVPCSLTRADFIITAVAIVMVRVLVSGVRLAHG